MISTVSSLGTDARRILESHLSVGSDKAVSYLPIATIEKVLKLSVVDYQLLVEERGDSTAIFQADDSCIKSGAVYVFSRANLEKVLQKNQAILLKYGWPVTAEAFVTRIAAQWLDEGHPILPIVKKAFGD